MLLSGCIGTGLWLWIGWARTWIRC